MSKITQGKINSKRSYKGRAISSNAQKRFTDTTREFVDDGWNSTDWSADETATEYADESTKENSKHSAHLVSKQLKTIVQGESAKTVISYNNSPDVGFDRSINPYRGCEHGCVYCFARPTHAYLNLSPGLDFESRLFYKSNADQILRKELEAKNYRPAPLALGINTDAYQPVEKQLGITRKILKVLHEYNHPLTIVTKSSLVERDMDILSDLAKNNLVKIVVSVTTLQSSLARTMEPRATAPTRRIALIENLAINKIPVGVLVAPIIPVLTDHELEKILDKAKNAGAESAGYVLIRLPHEVKELFQEWLSENFPGHLEHVMNRIRDCRDGKEYNAEFGKRMTGTGVYAELIRNRFKIAIRKYKLQEPRSLETSLFKNGMNKNQFELF